MAIINTILRYNYTIDAPPIYNNLLKQSDRLELLFDNLSVRGEFAIGKQTLTVQLIIYFLIMLPMNSAQKLFYLLAKRKG